MGPDELVAEPLGSRDEPVPEVVGLRVNGLIILSQCDGGPWSRSSGLFGNVSRNGIESTANSTLVHVHSVDAWTGLSDAGVYSLDCVAKPQLLYGKAVTDADTLRGLFSANEAALGTHFARRLIGHIAANWPPKVPISVGTCWDYWLFAAMWHTGTVLLLLLSAGTFGNTESLVQLIKLMAASEYVFQSKASSGALDGPDSTAIAHSSTESKSLRALRALLVKLLAQENRSARHKGRHRRDEDDDEESLLSAVLLKECVSHFKLQAAQKGGRKDSAASNRLMAESLHPYFHTSDYRGEVHLPGAKSIRVTFDHRW